MRKDFRVLGKLSDVVDIRKEYPEVSWKELEKVSQLRKFRRWCEQNKGFIHACALATPIMVTVLFQLAPSMTHTLVTSEAVPAFATTDTSPASIFSGHGVILLHMLVLGFVTLVVTTFLKFTGRGEIIPLVVFVGGGVILLEVLKLFKAIYHEVETFINM